MARPPTPGPRFAATLGRDRIALNRMNALLGKGEVGTTVAKKKTKAKKTTKKPPPY